MWKRLPVCGATWARKSEWRIIFWIDLDLLRETQIVRHSHHDDAVEDRFVSGRLEFLPLGLIRMGDDDGRRRPGRDGPGAGTTFPWVAVIMQWRYSIPFLKTSINLTKPRLPTFSAPLTLDARIAFRVEVQLGNVLAADQAPMCPGYWDPPAEPRRCRSAPAWKTPPCTPGTLRTCRRILLQPETAYRAQISLDMHAQHLLEFFS